MSRRSGFANLRWDRSQFTVGIAYSAEGLMSAASFMDGGTRGEFLTEKDENHSTTTPEDERRGWGGSAGDIGEGPNASPSRRCRYLGSSTWRDHEPDVDGGLGIAAGAGRISLPI